MAPLSNAYSSARVPKQGGSLYHFLSLVLPGRNANPRPTTREADTPTTKPPRRGFKSTESKTLDVCEDHRYNETMQQIRGESDENFIGNLT